jgi:class 3 adenylate cyclase
MAAPLETLASYVPDLIVRRLATNPERVTWPACDRFLAAVLFADVTGFTPLTEWFAHRGAIGAEELSDQLNDYYERLVNHLLDHGGDVVKFAGDALLAVWPTDALKEDLATVTLRAAQCGRVVQEDLRDYKTREGIALNIRVGVGVGGWSCSPWEGFAIAGS